MARVRIPNTELRGKAHIIKPLISVITVVYNGENCIEKTVDSVLMQSYENKEYIIVDGASTDHTLSLIQPYADKIDKILSEPDKGIYDAMNKGLEFATGDYVIFMNCDDTFKDRNTLRAIAEAIESHGYPDFIYGDAIEASSRNDEHFVKKARNIKFLWYGMFAHHQSMVYKTSIIKTNHITYDLQYKIGADYAFTAQFLKQAQKTVYIEEPLCIFMQDGVSAIDYKTGLKEQWDIRKNILKYNFLMRSLIFAIHFMAIMIRRNIPFVYNKLRFQKE